MIFYVKWLLEGENGRRQTEEAQVGKKTGEEKEIGGKVRRKGAAEPAETNGEKSVFA